MDNLSGDFDLYVTIATTMTVHRSCAVEWSMPLVGFGEKDVQ